jgi:hypothetical protein
MTEDSCNGDEFSPHCVEFSGSPMNSRHIHVNSSSEKGILSLNNEFKVVKWEFIWWKMNSLCVAMNSPAAMLNSCHQRRILPWPVEFVMAGWEFILRLIRIHVLEDEFLGVAMNSFAAMLNSLESIPNPCHQG